MYLSKTDYVTYLKHPAWLWLKKHSPDVLPKLDENSQAVIDGGIQFEHFAETIFDNAVKVESKEFGDFEARAAETKRLIEQRTEVILQAVFINGDYLCIADALKLTDDGYELIEIKAVTKPDKEHYCDLAFQKAVIENSGTPIVRCFVLHANKDYIRLGDIKVDETTQFTDVTLQVEKQILEQPKSTIDFDDIINSGKILICNFSKGLLGEDTSELFGITVLAKLQLASLRRARLSQTERRPFYLYVDEFQNFATQSFVQMLSESRKYKLFMTMAEQSTSQQKDQQMVSIILANVGTVVCFRTGNPEDERLLLPLFSPYIQEGEISNLNAFNYYVKLSAMKAQEPLSGQTLLLEEEGNESIVHKVIKHSQQLYGRKEGISTSLKITKARGANTNTVNQSEVVVPGQD